jgi:vancomycin aglycone glucosyltransferase
MRLLLSTIGSRGDVQPLVALALELRALGAEVRLCVPPDFREWIEGLGLPVTPIGPELQNLTTATPPTPAPISPERRRQMIDGTVATQFDTITAAAGGCDMIVGATALQVAAGSIAEHLGIPYVFVAFCPTVLPSPHHPPIPLGMIGDVPAPDEADNRERWARDARRWNEMWGPPLNAQRAALGLAPVEDVRGYIFTDRPWLAADPTLAPWPDPEDRSVFRTAAWILHDARPLSAEIERFLDNGDAPIYFGFGSIRAPRGLSEAMIGSARALGRRSIVSRGWAELSSIDDARDCLTIGEVNQQVLFARVAAVVHHGGAGTTTAAARAGAPQVVIPQMYDQHYWARRVAQLGVGIAHAPGAPSAESLASALEHTLRPEVAARARTIALTMPGDGARVAAAALLAAPRSLSRPTRPLDRDPRNG